MILNSCTISNCPDSDINGSELVVLSIGIDEEMAWNEEIRDEGQYDYKIINAIENSETNVNIDNDRMLIANEIYHFKEDLITKIPDSLKQCNFGKNDNQIICSVSRPDTLYNSYLDSSYLVENAVNILYELDVEVNTDELIILKQRILDIDSAQFISENRYEIDAYHNPDFNIETDAFYFQKSEDIRELVLNSSEEVVNDILFYRELNQMLIEGSSTENLFSYGQVNPNEKFPELDVSFISQKYAYSKSGEIYLLDISGTKPTHIAKGNSPFFFSDGDKLLFRSQTSTSTIYDLNTKSFVKISDGNSVKYAISQKNSEYIYYLTESGLYLFDVVLNHKETILEFSSYIESREAEEEGNLYVSVSPSLLFNDPDENEMKILLFTDYNLYYSCE